MKQMQKMLPMMGMMAVMLIVTTTEAWAGTTGLVFQTAYNTLVGWVQGYGGKIFAVLSFFIGLGVAAWTKSLLPPLLGIGIAFLVAYGVAIIQGVATATI
jgi:conjugal transfer pilus assembly protein TraA